MSKVAILIPSLKKGGAEKQACLLARAIKDTHDVILIVMVPSAGLDPENLKIADLHDDQLILLSGGVLAQTQQLFNVLKKNHVEYLFCYLTRPDLVGPVVGKLAGVRTVYQGIRNVYLPSYKILMERLGGVFATGAVNNSHAGAQILSRRGIAHQRVIPNCYLNSREAQERSGNEEVRVITVARFVKQKDYQTAVKSVSKAMKAVPRLRYTIIGYGFLEDQIRGWLKEEGIEDKTEILLNPKGVIDYVNKADIYLSCSLAEGTSNSIMEALDLSIPVVATDVGDNARLVAHGVNGFIVDTGDVDSIADHLIQLANSQSLRNTMGKKGNSRLKELYSFEVFRQAYLDLIANS